MASRKLTKQQMREDQFRDALTEIYVGTLTHLERFWKAYLAGLLVVAAAGAGGWYLWNRHRESLQERQYLLSRVMEALNAPVGEKADAGASPNLTFPSEAARQKEVESRFQAFSKEASGAARKTALLLEASSLLQKGKADEAVSRLSPLVSDGTYGPLALSLRAAAHEGAGRYDRAEADYKTLASLKSPLLPAGEGAWLLGQFYERRGQKEKALSAYEQAEKALPEAEEGKEPGLLQRVKKRVEALKEGA
jgi:tetratricopeptide (TPR) repeat protein